MACFDNYIGIEQCEGETPSSGKYLKDGGISRYELDMIAGKDYKDGVEFGEGKLTWARNLVVADIYNHFSDKYKSQSIIDNGRVGYTEPNMTTFASVNELRGIELQFNSKSLFTKLYIKDIELFTDYTGNISVYVYDVYQNKLLDTFTLASVADQISTVSVNQYYTSDRKNLDLAILYSTNGINQYKTYINSGGCKGCSVNSFMNCDSGFLTAKGVYKDGTQVISSNLKGLGHTAGMSVNYSVICDHENWICLHKQQLAIPIIYKASSEIITYAMNQSNRVNYETMDMPAMEKRRDFYELQYREQMDNILKNIRTPNDNICFVCKSSTITRQMMP